MAVANRCKAREWEWVRRQERGRTEHRLDCHTRRLNRQFSPTRQTSSEAAPKCIHCSNRGGARLRYVALVVSFLASSTLIKMASSRARESKGANARSRQPKAQRILFFVMQNFQFSNHMAILIKKRPSNPTTLHRHTPQHHQSTSKEAHNTSSQRKRAIQAGWHRSS